MIEILFQVVEFFFLCCMVAGLIMAVKARYNNQPPDKLYSAMFVIYGLGLCGTVWAWQISYLFLPTLMVLLGGFMNMVVCLSNGGRMPVAKVGIDSSRHQSTTDRTRFYWLCDCINIPWFGMFSIGDVVILLAMPVGIVRVAWDVLI